MAIDRRMVQLRDDLGYLIHDCDYEVTALVEDILDRIAKDINEFEPTVARWLRGQT